MSDPTDSTIVQLMTYFVPAQSHKMLTDKAMECKLQTPSAIQVNWAILCYNTATESCSIAILPQAHSATMFFIQSTNKYQHCNTIFCYVLNVLVSINTML